MLAVRGHVVESADLSVKRARVVAEGGTRDRVRRRGRDDVRKKRKERRILARKRCRDEGAKLAAQARDSGSRGTRTRRRPNGDSLSSRGSATGMQCGLCAVVAGLFRRAMCIAGSRRGSGESCYQELATDLQGRRHSQVLVEEHAEIELVKASECVAERVRDVVVVQAHEVRARY